MAYAPTVIFSDIDGTFLDHHTYEAPDGIEVLNNLQKHAIPLVFCSSKTFAEQTHLQQTFGMSHPFIFENGSAIAIPSGYFPPDFYQSSHNINGYDIVPVVKTTLLAIREVLKGLGDITFYGNAPDTTLQLATGLPAEALTRAKARWYTETIITPLSQDTRQSINAQLSSCDLTLSQGGRFDTVQSIMTDKGHAVAWLMPLFTRKYCVRPLFVGIGDSANDLAMLNVVDRAFLVQKPDGSWATSDGINLTNVPAIGPKGFLKMLEILLDED